MQLSRALQIMAIVNRTPDSFYDRGATFVFDAAMERVHDVVRDGAMLYGPPARMGVIRNTHAPGTLLEVRSCQRGAHYSARD